MHKVFLVFIPIISIKVQRNPIQQNQTFDKSFMICFALHLKSPPWDCILSWWSCFQEQDETYWFWFFFVCFLTWVWVHKGHGYNGQNPIWIRDQIPFKSLCVFYFFLFLCELCLVLFLCNVFSLSGCFSLIWFGIIVGCT